MVPGTHDHSKDDAALEHIGWSKNKDRWCFIILWGIYDTQGNETEWSDLSTGDFWILKCDYHAFIDI